MKNVFDSNAFPWLTAKGIATGMALAYAFAPSAPVAFADHLDDASAAVYGLQEKDEAACAKSFKSGAFTFTPLTRKSGHVTSFKISRGDQVLLTKKSTDEFSTCWISYPVMKVPIFKHDFNPNRLIADVVGMHPVRGASPFVDLNGDGVWDVIVGSYSGGAHCCYEFHVYSLGITAKDTGELPGDDTQCVLADLLGDGKYEAVGVDWIFSYWNAASAFSPAEVVILNPGKNGYTLAPDLMRTSAPSASAFQALVNECQKEIPDDLPKDKPFGITPTIWKNMLPLIYSGHSDLAWKLLDKVWPAGMRGNFEDKKVPMTKDAFRKAFLEQLSASAYWAGLKELNKTDPILCSFAPKPKDRHRISK